MHLMFKSKNSKLLNSQNDKKNIDGKNDKFISS